MSTHDFTADELRPLPHGMRRLGVFAPPEKVHYLDKLLHVPIMKIGSVDTQEFALKAIETAALDAGLPPIDGWYGIDCANGEFIGPPMGKCLMAGDSATNYELRLELARANATIAALRADVARHQSAWEVVRAADIARANGSDWEPMR